MKHKNTRTQTLLLYVQQAGPVGEGETPRQTQDKKNETKTQTTIKKEETDLYI